MGPFTAAWVSAALLVVAPPAGAWAQAATALDRYEPTPAGDALFASADADVGASAAANAGILLGYAHRPLSLVAEGEDVGDVVDHQLLLHLLASTELFGRVKLELDAPFVLAQGGDTPQLAGSELASPSGASTGDLRVGARLPVVRRRGAWPAAAVSFTAWFPTGDDGAFAGTGGVRIAPAIIVGGDVAPWLWRASGARRFATRRAGLLASEVIATAGVARRFGPLQAGPELWLVTVADEGVSALSKHTTDVEALLGADLSAGPVTARLAVGPGLTPGIGTPSFRILGGAHLTFDVMDDERDRRGVESPAYDERRAPPAPASTRPRQTGRAEAGLPPPDGDGDGVADGDDACPSRAGVASYDPTRDGCPADDDGDRVPNDVDACPSEPGPTTADAATAGCPAAVRLSADQIVLLGEVSFVTGAAEVLKPSEAPLAEVAQILARHPEIARVGVDGHTDDVGSLASNTELSQRRALAVVRWLVEHGVDPRRVEARAFGPRQPIADNATPEGRARNRRVEFQILKRTDRGEAGWIDGPIE